MAPSPGTVPVTVALNPPVADGTMLALAVSGIPTKLPVTVIFKGDANTYSYMEDSKLYSKFKFKKVYHLGEGSDQRDQ